MVSVWLTGIQPHRSISGRRRGPSSGGRRPNSLVLRGGQGTRTGFPSDTSTLAIYQRLFLSMKSILDALLPAWLPKTSCQVMAPGSGTAGAVYVAPNCRGDGDGGAADDEGDADADASDDNNVDCESGHTCADPAERMMAYQAARAAPFPIKITILRSIALDEMRLWLANPALSSTLLSSGMFSNPSTSASVKPASSPVDWPLYADPLDRPRVKPEPSSSRLGCHMPAMCTPSRPSQLRS
mmetsp:Transcript_30548/g.98772  ORF Transcript_30548/g.98772 Transcript_30548/m.98772 type:complete len:240 (+) Transcript_30548:995-1714(+)